MALTDAQLIEARHKLSAGRITAYKSMPYFTQALMAIEPREEEGFGTFAVDSRWRMYYDPIKCLEWTVSELAAVWLHEVNHLIRNHSKRFENLQGIGHNSKIFNAAGDASINTDLRNQGFVLPDEDVRFYSDRPNPLSKRWRKGMTAEEMYWKACEDLGLSVGGDDKQQASTTPEDSNKDSNSSDDSNKDSNSNEVEDENPDNNTEQDNTTADSANDDNTDSNEDVDSEEGLENETNSGEDDRSKDNDNSETAESDSKSQDSDEDTSPDDDHEIYIEDTQGGNGAAIDGEQESEDDVDSESESTSEETSGSGESSEDSDGSESSQTSGGQSSNSDGNQDDENSNDVLDKNGNPIEDFPDCGSCVDNERREYESRDDDDGSVDPSTAEWLRKKTAEDIIEYEKSNPGTVGSDLLREAKEVMEPIVDWRKDFANFVRRVAAKLSGYADFSYRRPSKKAQPGIMLPSMAAPPPPNIGVVLDSSGSMGEKTEIAAGLGEIQEIIKRFGRSGEVPGIYVITCDAKAHVQKVKDISEIDLFGGGGTDMTVGIDKAVELRPLLDIIITITDGYTPWPAKKPTKNPKAIYIALITGERGSIEGIPKWMKIIQVTVSRGKRKQLY